MAAVEGEGWNKGEEDERGGEQFDETVKTEGEQRWAVSSGGGPERDGALDEHPDEGDGLKHDERARIGGEGWHGYSPLRIVTHRALGIDLRGGGFRLGIARSTGPR